MSYNQAYEKWVNANQAYLSLSLQLVYQHLENYASTNVKNAEKVESSSVLQELSALRSSMQYPPALETMIQVLGLSGFEKNILLLCTGVELDARFSVLLYKINGNSQPSFALALSVFNESHWSAISPGGTLRYWNIIEIGKGSIKTQAPINLDEHILYFLTGVGTVNEKLLSFADPVHITEQPSPQQQQKLNELVVGKLQGNEIFPSIILTGNDVRDKGIAAKYIADKTGLQLFKIPALSLQQGNVEVSELAKLWNREAMLSRYMLMLECEQVELSDKQRLQPLHYFVSKIKGPLIISTDGWMPELDGAKLIMDIPKPTGEEQIMLWQSLLGETKAGTNGMLDRIVSQFSLTHSAIRKAASEMNGTVIKEQKKNEMEIEKKLWTICSQLARPHLDDLAQRIEPVATWDDLILPEQQKNILREIIVHVKNRNTVYNRWGFASKGLRGLGISALFTGESGTGKTMASEVLANTLNLDLYKIDLSKVVNKYIGETEKNLKRIFDAAENGGAILLFDEADALFGKRSDVKDSHDRYSNIEVSYLLQRMEAYRGLAILTTNMKSALDKAFLRRIRFIIQFPFPDATQRAQIWNNIFPGAMPKEKLDMDKLSRLTIAGGNIRNIAMNAAFLAANDQVPVQMEHIIRATKMEYAKMEIPYSNDLKLQS